MIVQASVVVRSVRRLLSLCKHVLEGVPSAREPSYVIGLRTRGEADAAYEEATITESHCGAK